MILRHIQAVEPEGVSHDPEILKRVLLRRGEAAHVLQYAVTTFEPGQIVQPHRHDDMVEVFFCTEGAGAVVLDGQEHPIGPGTFFVCEPGETHEVRSSPDEAMRLIVIAIQV